MGSRRMLRNMSQLRIEVAKTRFTFFARKFTIFRRLMFRIQCFAIVILITTWILSQSYSVHATSESLPKLSARNGARRVHYSHVLYDAVLVPERVTANIAFISFAVDIQIEIRVVGIRTKNTILVHMLDEIIFVMKNSIAKFAFISFMTFFEKCLFFMRLNMPRKYNVRCKLFIALVTLLRFQNTDLVIIGKMIDHFILFGHQFRTHVTLVHYSLCAILLYMQHQIQRITKYFFTLIAVQRFGLFTMTSYDMRVQLWLSEKFYVTKRTLFFSLKFSRLPTLMALQIGILSTTRWYRTDVFLSRFICMKIPNVTKQCISSKESDFA